jgi:predicted alpha/beta-hydrolase family hydrolase
VVCSTSTGTTPGSQWTFGYHDAPVGDPPLHTLSEHRFLASESAEEVSALLLEPADARCLLVFGHGAGAGMRHSFMEAAVERLADRGIASFRYQFPYMEKGSRRPDYRPILLKTVRSAVDAARGVSHGLPLFAGGKSMGGRMTSMALSGGPPDAVKGVVFFGFPLHPAGKPGVERADHLSDLSTSMLFLQGTRDKLAPLDLLLPVCEGLGQRATLHIVEGADHGFHVLKRSGRTDDEVLEELADTTRAWTNTVIKSEN